MNLAEKNMLDHFEFQQITDGRFQIYRAQSEIVKNSFADDVLDGLKSNPKKLLPKYFYDDIGSDLFDKITGTPEYYPTRTERKILKKYIDDIRLLCQNARVVAELGSGTSEKTRIILDSFLSGQTPVTYVPIDVSDILISSSEHLLAKHENLRVTGIIAEYQQGLNLLSEFDEDAKLVIFLGSSIGNFDYGAANDLLNDISDSLNKKDYLLIGFDLVKETDVLNKAYNDSQKYTESFNLNILDRINRELGGQFISENFRHKAYYNSMASRIEMHLVSELDQEVIIEDLNTSIYFKKGESVHTENSYKFTDARITEMAEQAGLQVIKIWKDEKKYFALTLFRLC